MPGPTYGLSKKKGEIKRARKIVRKTGAAPAAASQQVSSSRPRTIKSYPSGTQRRIRNQLSRRSSATSILKEIGPRIPDGLSSSQFKVLKTIVNTGKQMGATDKEILSAVETGLVESNLQNLPGGDGTSVGWRQEISTYGSQADRMNVKAGAQRYFSETKDFGRGAGMSAGELAANVQRPAEQYRGRYAENEAKARQLLGQMRPNTPEAKAARRKLNASTKDLVGLKIIKPPKSQNAAGPSVQFVNFSKRGTKWLQGTSGNEVLKFQKPLADALIKLAKASGEPIKVNSGFRSNQEQAALYQAYLNGTGNLAAPPGQSNHNRGAAADVQLTARQRELAPQFGLGFPVGGEDWHIELVGNAANQIVGGSAPASGGVFDFSAPSGSSSSPFDTKPLGNRKLTPAEQRIKRRRNRVLNSTTPTAFNSTVPNLSVPSSSTVKAPVLDI